MQKNERKLSFGLVFAGLLFFCNPMFAAVDVLPDFLGCLLLFFGLFRLSRIHPPFLDAGKRFLKVAAVDAAKDILLLFVLVDGTSAEKPTAILTVAFGAVALELFLLIPAVGTLFDEMTALAMRGNCTPLYATHFRGRSRGEIIRIATIVFLVVRDVVCLLPEFAALTLQSTSSAEQWNLYEYIGTMRGLASTLAGLCGVVWLIFLCRYFLCLHRQSAFRGELYRKYCAYMESHPGVRVRTRHTVAFLMLAAGAFFTADFYLDFKNVIPDAIAAALFAAGVLVLPVDAKKKGIATLAAAVYGGVATRSSSLAYRFATEFRASEIGRSDAATSAYRALWLSSLLEFAAFLAFVAALVICLRETVFRYAGYRPEHESEFESKKLKDLRAGMDNGFIRLTVFALLAGLCSFLYDYIKDVPGSGFFRILEFFWFFDMLMSLLFGVILSVTLAGISGQIKNKYLFESITPDFLPNTISVPGNQKGDRKENAESQSKSEQPESEQSEQPESEQSEPEQAEQSEQESAKQSAKQSDQ